MKSVFLGGFAALALWAMAPVVTSDTAHAARGRGMTCTWAWVRKCEPGRRCTYRKVPISCTEPNTGKK